MSRTNDGTTGRWLSYTSGALPITAYPHTLFGVIWPNSVSTECHTMLASTTIASAGNSFGLTAGDGSGGQQCSLQYNNAGSWETTTGPNYTTGEWNYIAGVGVSSTSRYVRNGSSIGTTDTTSFAFPSGQGSINIGAWRRTSAFGFLDGKVAHVAAWNVELTTAELDALCVGHVSPLLIRPNSLVFYTPYLGRDSTEIDIIGGRTLANTNMTTSLDEPPVVWAPGKRKIFLPAASGFQSAWARNSNVMIGA